MGHAIEDLVAAEIVYRRALQHPNGVYNRQYSPRRES
jgi:ornithine cyclodeaminase/alanine dehydrogenase-like protein (mu-crystallin family)